MGFMNINRLTVINVIWLQRRDFSYPFSMNETEVQTQNQYTYQKYLCYLTFFSIWYLKDVMNWE